VLDLTFLSSGCRTAASFTVLSVDLLGTATHQRRRQRNRSALRRRCACDFGFTAAVANLFWAVEAHLALLPKDVSALRSAPPCALSPKSCDCGGARRASGA
jgi:hypothetical protein